MENKDNMEITEEKVGGVSAEEENVSAAGDGNVTSDTDSKTESDAKDDAQAAGKEKSADNGNSADNGSSADDSREALSDDDILDLDEAEKKLEKEGKAPSRSKSSVLDQKSGSKKPLKSTDDFVNKQKKRKRNRRIITIVIILFIAFFLATYIQYTTKKQKDAFSEMANSNVEMATVECKTLYNTTNATGTLKSPEARTLTANLGSNVATINKVNVEVGDIVTEGDILVEFSTEDIEKDIANKKDDISTQKQLDAINAADEQRSYVNSYSNAANSIQDAAKKVDKALFDLKEACNGYGDAKRKLERIRNGEETGSEEVAQSQVNQAFQAQEAAQKAYDQAVEDQARAINQVQTDSLSSADSKYQQSQINAGKQVKELARQLEKYEDSLDEYIVTASISGIVTEINVTEGNRFASGNVLTIQDHSGYEAEVLVDEYDIGDVKRAYDRAKAEGKDLKVVVKTEATEDKEFKGHVSSIAPTSTTTASASSSGSSGSAASTSSTVNYKVGIKLDETDDYLMIGMSAKVAIVVEESPEGALCVPYNAVQEKSDGTFVVRLMDKSYVSDHSDRMQAPEGEEEGNVTDSGIVVENKSGAGGQNGQGGGGSLPGMGGSANDMKAQMKSGPTYFEWLFGKKGDPDAEIDEGPKYTEVEVEKIFDTDYYAAIVPKYAGSIREGDAVMIVRETGSGNDLLSMFPGGGPR